MPKSLVVLLNLRYILLELISVVGYGINLLKFLNFLFSNNSALVHAKDLSKLLLKLILVFKHHSNVGISIVIIYIIL
jgi:hypothetical protein